MLPGNAYTPHERVTSDPHGKSRTKQAFKDEVDINNILRKHEKGLLTDHLNAHQGEYGNFINAPDYHTAMIRIREADESFMTIPAEIRATFDHDPAKFLAFAQDPDNLDAMIDMGLAPAKQQKDAPDPPAAPPAAPPADPPADPPAIGS